MKKITTFSFLLLSTVFLNAQESVGLISNVPEAVPEGVAQWGKLVGNWDIVVDMIGEDGEVAQRFNAEWNWFYIMNGLAIQDVFILPKRTNDLDPSNYFIGTGIRIYNENEKKWQTSWLDTSTKKIELREAVSDDDQIVIIHDSGESRLRYTYYDMMDDSFKWKQESADDNGNWKVTQTVVAKKRG